MFLAKSGENCAGPIDTERAGTDRKQAGRNSICSPTRYLYSQTVSLIFQTFDTVPIEAG